MKEENKLTLNFPSRLLSPIRLFLEKELVKLKRIKKQLKKEDLVEQIEHFDKEVKAKFLSKQIAQFRIALTRMKIGKYGICEKCGNMIDTDRLAARPEATTCVKCSKEND